MRLLDVSLGAALLLVLSMPSHAQSPAEFYKGKNVELYIGYSVGGGYDLYAPLLARQTGLHIPSNPTLVAKDMEGAGSLQPFNRLLPGAPTKGSPFGFMPNGTSIDSVGRL